MLTSSLNVTISQQFDALIVLLPGPRYDSFSDRSKIKRLRQSLAELVDETQRTHLVIDLSSTRQFGAALLGTVVALSKLLRQRGKQLVVCGDHLGLFRLTNLHSLFPVSDDLQDALRWCSQATETIVA